MNPRLWKEAFFYEKQGFNVTILTMWQSADLRLKDLEILNGHVITYEPYLNLIPGEINPLARFFFRLRKKCANEIQRLLHIGTGWAISHAPEQMRKSALSVNADLYSAHLECSFFVGKDLIKEGKKVSFDFEDWYSRDYLVPERPVQLLAKLEKFAVQNGLFCTAASRSMALALEQIYGSAEPITVIYNGFSKNESTGIIKEGEIDYADKVLKLLWFSRTVGPNRGIECLLKALSFCDLRVELHLLGEMAQGYAEFLERSFPYSKGHFLKFHPFIPHKQLIPFIASFKIGLAIEENINDNRQLTITNKMLQYIQAGLFVIASDTQGQREIAEFFGDTIFIVDINKPAEFADAIQKLSKRKKVNHEEQYQKIFSWEAQEVKFNKLIEKYL